MPPFWDRVPPPVRKPPSRRMAKGGVASGAVKMGWGSPGAASYTFQTQLGSAASAPAATAAVSQNTATAIRRRDRSPGQAGTGDVGLGCAAMRGTLRKAPLDRKPFFEGGSCPGERHPYRTPRHSDTPPLN